MTRHWLQIARRAVDRHDAIQDPAELGVLHDIEGTDEGYEIGVPRLWGELRAEHPCTEVVTYPGVKYGTGLVWL